MPKVKRTTTEVQEIEAPQDQTEVHVPQGGSEAYIEFLNSLKSEDWADEKREIYVYQIEPPLTKKEGETAYAIRSCAPVALEMISERLPQATRIKIISMLRGERTRRVWVCAMVPRPVPAPGQTSVATNSETAQIFKQGADLLQRSTDVSQAAMKQGIDIIGEAHRQAIAMSGKQESSTEMLVKMKELGLLKGESGLDFQKIQGFLGFALGALKDAGIISAAPKEATRGRLSEIREMLDFLEEIRGTKGAVAEAPVWLNLLSTFGPQVAKTLENVTGNVVRILELRSGLAGTPGGGTAIVPASAMQPALQPAPPPTPAPPANGTPATAPGQNISDWIKQQLVNLYKAGYNARRIALWVEMTAPELITELSKVPDALAVKLFDADPILYNIGQDDPANEFKAALLKRLREVAAKPAEPPAPGAATPEPGTAPAKA